MVLTIASPPVGARIGPGLGIVVNTSIGPTLLDDRFILQIVDTALTSVLCYGTKLCAGLTTGTVVMGQSEGPLSAISLVRGMPDNTASSIVAYAQHHTGVFFDGPTIFPGYLWDPVTGLWKIVGANPDTAVILAAVQKLFQNAP